MREIGTTRYDLIPKVEDFSTVYVQSVFGCHRCSVFIILFLHFSAYLGNVSPLNILNFQVTQPSLNCLEWWSHLSRRRWGWERLISSKRSRISSLCTSSLFLDFTGVLHLSSPSFTSLLIWEALAVWISWLSTGRVLPSFIAGVTTDAKSATPEAVWTQSLDIGGIWLASTSSHLRSAMGYLGHAPCCYSFFIFSHI